jgi:hypothetical protein
MISSITRSGQSVVTPPDLDHERMTILTRPNSLEAYFWPATKYPKPKMRVTMTVAWNVVVKRSMNDSVWTLIVVAIM